MFSEDKDITINIKNRNFNSKIEEELPEEPEGKPIKKNSTIFQILCCYCLFCFEDNDYYN
jgi:hypothetical protein